jgi:HSP20 family protein
MKEEKTTMLYRTSSLSAPVFGLRREIDRLFEDTFGRGDVGASGAGSTWSPAVDIRENAKELTLELELPGINPEQVELTVDNGVLNIKGEKRGERKEGDENSRYHIVERSYGSFMRSFQLPQGVDESKIDADFNNGILSIHIPKAALPQPHRIQIGVNSNSSGKQQQAQVSGGQTTPRQTGQKNESRAAGSTRSREPESDMAASAR